MSHKIMLEKKKICNHNTNIKIQLLEIKIFIQEILMIYF